MWLTLFNNIYQRDTEPGNFLSNFETAQLLHILRQHPTHERTIRKDHVLNIVRL